KFELEDHARWRDARDVERDVAAYIDGFYNAERRHSHNRYQSPVDFERYGVPHPEVDTAGNWKYPAIRVVDLTA
ncbi:MAG TPA: hypothetical protein VFT22_25995, partial [Kofleriaceae bacterium]|nr:hypothetical protein [Kofleriaceae bacterium]